MAAAYRASRYEDLAIALHTCAPVAFDTDTDTATSSLTPPPSATAFSSDDSVSHRFPWPSTASTPTSKDEATVAFVGTSIVLIFDEGCPGVARTVIVSVSETPMDSPRTDLAKRIAQVYSVLLYRTGRLEPAATIDTSCSLNCKENAVGCSGSSATPPCPGLMLMMSRHTGGDIDGATRTSNVSSYVTTLT